MTLTLKIKYQVIMQCASISISRTLLLALGSKVDFNMFAQIINLWTQNVNMCFKARSRLKVEYSSTTITISYNCWSKGCLVT